MAFSAPTEAGLGLTAPAANNTLWLNYSSIKTATGADMTRNVQVSLSAVVPGVDIKLTAAAQAGSGAGTLGTPAAQLILSATPQTIISGIGSAYTGTGTGNGHNLTYDLAPSAGNYANLTAAAAASTTVVYTISDN